MLLLNVSSGCFTLNPLPNPSACAAPTSDREGFSPCPWIMPARFASVSPCRRRNNVNDLDMAALVGRAGGGAKEGSRQMTKVADQLGSCGLNGLRSGLGSAAGMWNFNRSIKQGKSRRRNMATQLLRINFNDFSLLTRILFEALRSINGIYWPLKSHLWDLNFYRLPWRL